MAKHFAGHYNGDELRAMSPDDLDWKPYFAADTHEELRDSKIVRVPLGKLKASIIYKPNAPADLPQYEIVVYDGSTIVPIPGINGSSLDPCSHMDRIDVMPRLADIADSPENAQGTWRTRPAML